MNQVGDAIRDVMALELHDAVLEAYRVNVAGNSLTLSVRAYLTSDSKARTSVEIEFIGLRDLSGTLDLPSLATNAKAGNISYWAPSPGEGRTFVYLSNGCIAITAGSVCARVTS